MLTLLGVLSAPEDNCWMLLLFIFIEHSCYYMYTLSYIVFDYYSLLKYILITQK